MTQHGLLTIARPNEAVSSFFLSRRLKDDGSHFNYEVYKVAATAIIRGIYILDVEQPVFFILDSAMCLA